MPPFYARGKEAKAPNGVPLNHCYANVTIILLRDLGYKWRYYQRAARGTDPCSGILRAKAHMERFFSVFESESRGERKLKMPPRDPP